jgi:hypothetical protein
VSWFHLLKQKGGVSLFDPQNEAQVVLFQLFDRGAVALKASSVIMNGSSG